MRLRNQEKGVNLRKQLGEIPGVKIGDCNATSIKFPYR